MVKNLPAKQETQFDPWVRKIPWRRKGQPTPVFLPGKSQRQRSLVGYSSWGCKESDTALSIHTHPLPPINSVLQFYEMVLAFGHIIRLFWFLTGFLWIFNLELLVCPELCFKGVKALGSVCKSSQLVGKGKMQYIEIFDIYRPVFDFYSL